MSRRAWFSASTRSCANLRYSGTVRPACICQPSARSGSSICSRKPASTMALYSSCMASAMAKRYSSSRGVVLVLHPVLDGARRDGGEVGLRPVNALQRRLEVGDVLGYRIVARVRQRAGAHHLEAAQVAASLEVVGEVRRVPAVDARQHVARSRRPMHVPRQPLPRVVGEARLAQLAVVDAVQPDAHLPLHRLPDGLPQSSGQRGLIHLLTRALVQHHLPQVRHARRRARVHGQNAFRTPKHRLLRVVFLKCDPSRRHSLQEATGRSNNRPAASTCRPFAASPTPRWESCT